MASRAGLVFSLALVALFVGTLIAAQGFRSQAKLFPLVIGVVGLAFASIQLGREVRTWRLSREGDETTAQGLEAAEPSDVQTVPSPQARKRTGAIMGWIVGLVVAVWLLGFPVAVTLITLAYVRFGAGESWPISVGFAVANGAFFYLIFIQIVRIPFDEGILMYLGSP